MTKQLSDTQELLRKKSELKRKILTLEWDRKHRQIHFSLKEKLDAYKKELEALNAQLAGEPLEEPIEGSGDAENKGDGKSNAESKETTGSRGTSQEKSEQPGENTNPSIPSSQ
ncbi:hypothetical protein COY95_03875 [Candidatus Woesearchaeota archaeon CG_4_10_14_0_8_um_filter_47_5]|nr:MAG: hypothetical protein COY95_03875 [Candidatus Woesearchaeota archaeon CG_4_10_14_0_8_um_filter_47_5]